MGHTKLETTQRYMHMLNLNDDEWTCVGATTAKEATKLIENGFQYVTTIEGIQLFKKTQVTTTRARPTRAIALKIANLNLNLHQDIR
jgi:hypothetical protein